MPKTLEEIRILQAAELLDEDKKTLKDNWNDLTPEEQDAFDDVVNSSDDDDDNKGGDNKNLDVDKLPFKTQKELDDYIDAKLNEKATPPDKKDEDPDKIEIPDFFDKDYKPADWNEAFRTFLQKGGAKVITDLTEKQLNKKREDFTKQLEAVNKQIDADIDALSKDGREIPKLGTPERDELNKDLAKIATDYHMDNAPAAKVYEIYELNKGKVQPDDRRKDLARNVAGGGNGGQSNGKVPDYKDIKSKSMDQLLEEQGV